MCPLCQKVTHNTRIRLRMHIASKNLRLWVLSDILTTIVIVLKKIQIKEDIAVTIMNMTDIDKIGLSGPNITGESSYKLRKGDFEQASALYRTI